MRPDGAALDFVELVPVVDASGPSKPPARSTFDSTTSPWRHRGIQGARCGSGTPCRSSPRACTICSSRSLCSGPCPCDPPRPSGDAAEERLRSILTTKNTKLERDRHVVLAHLADNIIIVDCLSTSESIGWKTSYNT